MNSLQQIELIIRLDSDTRDLILKIAQRIISAYPLTNDLADIEQ